MAWQAIKTLLMNRLTSTARISLITAVLALQAISACSKQDSTQNTAQPTDSSPKSSDTAVTSYLDHSYPNRYCLGARILEENPQAEFSASTNVSKSELTATRAPKILRTYQFLCNYLERADAMADGIFATESQPWMFELLEEANLGEAPFYRPRYIHGFHSHDECESFRQEATDHSIPTTPCYEDPTIRYFKGLEAAHKEN